MAELKGPLDEFFQLLRSEKSHTNEEKKRICTKARTVFTNIESEINMQWRGKIQELGEVIGNAESHFQKIDRAEKAYKDYVLKHVQMAIASGSDCVEPSQCKNLLVAAIDFGTTGSGYAFSFKDDFNKDPTQISSNNWTGFRGLVSFKAPSAILLNNKKEFVAFGYEAEDQYGDLAMDEEHEKYYYFRRFKMLLFSEASASGLRRDIMLEDDFGKKIRALTIFSMSIKYLVEHLMKVLDNRLAGSVKVTDITWVLTVPAIWNDGAKQFMREAAQLAGIKNEDLLIALEPEAASLYCMRLPVDKLVKTDAKGGKPSSVFPNGTKYMVLDFGGGTVDITIHEVINQNTLKELNRASGGAWGGVKVDEAFKEMIISITGPDVYEKFCKGCTADYVDFFREFETKKRNVTSNKTTKETLRLPASLQNMYQEVKKKNLHEAVANSKTLQGKVKAVSDKLRVEPDILKGLFNESINNTVKHVQQLLKEKTSAGTSTIVLVGGFAESPFLQEAIKTNFPNKRLIIPEEAGLAVLKGAVMFGHNPLTISSRIAKCSYGVRAYRDFQDGVHPRAKKTTVGGRVKCKDVFAVHVKKGQELKVNEPQSHQRYTPLEADQLSLVFDIYTSTEEDPMFVTDHSCSYLGQLEVEVPNLSGGKERGVFVNMIFGGTEIIVEAREEKDQTKMTRAKFDFLQ